MDDALPPASFDLAPVGERIRLTREYLGLSQQDFGEKLGFSRRQIIAWENAANAPHIALLAGIRQQFDIDPEWILLGPGRKPLRDVGAKEIERRARVQADVEKLVRTAGLTATVELLGQVVRSIETDPPVPALAAVVGTPPMGGFRAAIDAATPELRRARDLLHTLVDDVPGATLISGHALGASGQLESARTGFRPLADREGTRHGHGHQRVDVQPPVPQRRQPLLVDVEAGEPDRDGRHGKSRPAPDHGLRRKVADDLGADGQDQRPGQLGNLAPHDLVIMTVARRMAGLRFAPGDRLRVETGLAHGCQRWRDRRLVGIDREHPLAQLESQTANAGHAVKGTPDLGLFGRTVHRRDPEAAPAR